jgi:hypothetical protein
MQILDLETLELKNGSHREREAGVCLMEAVAWFANEPHSDHPQCASPVLTHFGIGLNDNFTDEYRKKLIPLIPKLVGTRNPNLEAARLSVLCNGVLRQILPASLRRFADRVQAAGDAELADKFRNHACQSEELPEIKISALALARTLARVRDLARTLDLARTPALARDLDLAFVHRALPVSAEAKYLVWDAAIELFDQAIAVTGPATQVEGKASMRIL